MRFEFLVLKVLITAYSLDSVTVTVRKLDPETQVLVKERIPPSGFLEHGWGNCATFNIRKVIIQEKGNPKLIFCLAVPTPII